MAGNGNDWNSFIQSKQVQTVMYSICVFFCLFYTVDGIMEMLSPERSANMMEAIGAPGYYALTIVRCVVLLITAGAFGRIVLRSMRGDD
ncbi:MAG: hypothetical protein Q4A07_00760 [Coriobacteriales bacterium]|nr:hypothetical protein [Coriobacteriales bacterium]